MFRKILNENFNLHFHAPISDSCRRCDSFKMSIMACTDERKKKELEFEKELHLRKAEEAREGMREDRELARQPEQDVTCIDFDLMKTRATPVLSTGVCYYKRQLWTYCLGIHDLASENAIMYLWNESIACRGAQEVGSCLLYYVKNFVHTRNLIMYSDQCGGQNRNIKLSLMCSYITTSPDNTVSRIDHKFLCSGHSYLPCDQDFGLVEKSKKYHSNIYVPNDWEVVVRTTRKKPFHVISMKKKTSSLQKVWKTILPEEKYPQPKRKWSGLKSSG